VVIVGRTVSVPFNRSVAQISLDPRSWPEVRRVLGRFAPDVVHVHEPISPSTSMAATFAATAPVVATFHAGSERRVALRIAWPLLLMVWRRLAVRIAVSEAAAAFGGGPHVDRIRIIPNGVDVELFASATPADLGEGPGPTLLFVNRLDPRKGFRVAIDAFARLAPGHPTLRLVVAGDGPDRGAVEGLPSSLRARVRMLGAVPHDDLPPYHAAADVFVGPALGRESFGIVLVEAMAAGLPVVASDIDGWREVVRDGLEAILVPPGDPMALAEAVGKVLADPALAARLTAAGRRRAQDYRWEVVTERIEQAYRDAVGGAAKMAS
jgi:phosphatidylinositol alpha-mannosyltransferase